jgi:hypothetical protein
MELDRPQNDGPAVCVIARQYFFRRLRLVALSVQGAFKKCHFLQFSFFEKIT